eukprot:TRINITY_DN2108_c0_g3_i2.p1 TRINITY_DN2108_c0_g3~~TRINITY_DN2108_c0_g3_i2.p1  ORF type:complete len:104 (+),score=10.66 TRINITY_DN2108_c0_g3_i2:960-1271(+)
METEWHLAEASWFLLCFLIPYSAFTVSTSQNAQKISFSCWHEIYFSVFFEPNKDSLANHCEGTCLMERKWHLADAALFLINSVFSVYSFYQSKCPTGFISMLP